MISGTVLLLLWSSFHSSLGFTMSRSNKSVSPDSLSLRGPKGYKMEHCKANRRFLVIVNSLNEKQTGEDEIIKPIPAAQEASNPPPPPRRMSSVEIMRAMGTSPRRIFVSTLSATGVALAANFLGSTSAILSQIPESTVEQTGLDTYYPRAGFKRYSSKLYTFVIPQEWVGDTALELQKAQLRAKPLDYSMKSSRRTSSVLPDVGTFKP